MICIWILLLLGISYSWSYPTAVKASKDTDVQAYDYRK